MTVRGRVVSHYDAVEVARLPRLLADVRAGRTVLVVTDAGMPAVSDPGYRLVAAAAAEGLPVTCLPGPSAVTTALVLSGLPVRAVLLRGLRAAPRRGAAALAGDAASPSRGPSSSSSRRTGWPTRSPPPSTCWAPSREAAVCRELTKKYEEVRRGTLAALAAGAVDDPVRGEVTVVLAGAAPAAAPSVDSLVGEVHERVAAGERLKDAAAAVAQAAGVPKRELYNAALVARS